MAVFVPFVLIDNSAEFIISYESHTRVKMQASGAVTLVITNSKGHDRP
jgi:hypothetical protein